jgi:hypothetical protein
MIWYHIIKKCHNSLNRDKNENWKDNKQHYILLLKPKLIIGVLEDVAINLNIPKESILLS